MGGKGGGGGGTEGIVDGKGNLKYIVKIQSQPVSFLLFFLLSCFSAQINTTVSEQFCFHLQARFEYTLTKGWLNPK